MKWGIVLLLFCLPVQANFIGIGQGLTGTQGAIEYKINDRWSVGATYSQSSMDLLKVEDVEIDVRLTTLKGYYYPFRGRFFLTGGILHNNSRADYTENYQETVTATSSILDLEESYTIRAKGKASMTYPKIGIYLGTGYNIPVSQNIHIRLEGGANYVGQPTIKGNLAIEDLPEELEPVVRGYVENELDEVRSDLDYRWWPAASITVMYRF